MTLSAAATTHLMSNDYLIWAFMIVLLISICYAIGRIHQFYRQGTARDDAFREGYDKATRSLFSLATRVARPHPSPRRGLPEEPTREPFQSARVRVDPTSPRGPRHRAADKRKVELAQTQQMKYGGHIGKSA